MPRRSGSRARKTRQRSARFRIVRFLPSKRTWRRWFCAFRGAPLVVQAIIGAAVVVSMSAAVNWTYQVVRKPSELWFPISEEFYKTPAKTWDMYGHLFERHATSSISAPFLAALAQSEGSGNPIARTYWRWAMTHQPFEIYRPASSAVGMYQITNSTFAEARRYCIHDHRVVEDGPWHAWRSCWFNGLYTRIVPSHSIEITSAYLDRAVAKTLERYPVPGATLQQKQNFAALVHLCGAGAGAAFARRGLQPAVGQRCGTHEVSAYLAKVAAYTRVFARLQARDD